MSESKNSKPNVIINAPKKEQMSHVAISQEDENTDTKEEKNYSQSLNLFTGLIKSVVRFFFDFLETIVVALSVFVVVYLFIIQPHEVKGSSMEPNFQNNEYIITDKLSYRFGHPQRGDVIIFKAPVNPDVDYIKRIVGLPGETVAISGGKVYINGKLLNESYLNDMTPLFPGGFMDEGVEIEIPPEHYFVMGDNRPHSSDSREFGPIPENLIIGRAVFRYWPVDELGLVPQVNYISDIK